jgi:hypothetical protein
LVRSCNGFPTFSGRLMKYCAVHISCWRAEVPVRVLSKVHTHCRKHGHLCPFVSFFRGPCTAQHIDHYAGGHSIIIVVCITREIKPSLHYPCVQIECFFAPPARLLCLLPYRLHLPWTQLLTTLIVNKKFNYKNLSIFLVTHF